MKAFWWFRENEIAGMARPGFNLVHWYEMPFDEAILLGWMGRYSTGVESLQTLHHHLESYAPQIYQYYKLNRESGARAIQVFQNPEAVQEIADRLRKRTQVFQQITVDNKSIRFSFNDSRLETEIQLLKERNVGAIVALTENHNQVEQLSQHFETHHLGIPDLDAPMVEQAEQLAEILKGAKSRKTFAIHCLAGIGRTSTMILAAHVLLGEDPEHLKKYILKKNPAFSLSGTQAKFVEDIIARSK